MNTDENRCGGTCEAEPGLRSINAFFCDDGTPLNYTLANL